MCFIVKDEEKWIGECIDHLKPTVTEFVLMDTGSTDRTIEVARAHGARIFQMPWPDDFSAARNACLEKATQPWILKIDPDERIDPKDLQKLAALTKTDGVAYQAWTRAYTNEISKVTLQSYEPCRGEYPKWEKNYRGYLTYPSIRLFKRLPGVHFVGKIHETVEPTLPGWKDGKSPVPPALDIFFHHYGHNDEAFEEKKKSPLYERLLHEEATRNRKNWYVAFELGNLYFERQNYPKAIEFLRQANDALPGKTQVLGNLGYALMLQGNWEDGEKILSDCLKVDPNYHDAHLNLGVGRLERGDLKRALECFNECLRLQPDSFMALRARGQCLAHLGFLNEAELAFRRALEIVPYFSELKVDLAILMNALGRPDDARSLIQAALQEDPENARAQALKMQFPALG